MGRVAHRVVRTLARLLHIRLYKSVPICTCANVCSKLQRGVISVSKEACIYQRSERVRAWSITDEERAKERERDCDIEAAYCAGMFIGHLISCYPARCRIAAHRENHNNARIVIFRCTPARGTSRFTHRVTRKRRRLRRMQRSSSVSDSIYVDKRSYLLQTNSFINQGFLFRSKNVISHACANCLRHEI